MSDGYCLARHIRLSNAKQQGDSWPLLLRWLPIRGVRTISLSWASSTQHAWHFASLTQPSQGRYQITASRRRHSAWRLSALSKFPQDGRTAWRPRTLVRSGLAGMFGGHLSSMTARALAERFVRSPTSKDGAPCSAVAVARACQDLTHDDATSPPG